MPCKISNDRWFSGDRYDISAEGCWVWSGSLQRDGYGSCTRRLGQTLAHRAFYIFFNGPIPEGREIDHLCRNRACVNPDHLEAVTHAENIARADYAIGHRNRLKTHCLRGHAFTPENTIVENYGARQQRKCRACRAAHMRRRYAQRKSA